MCRLRQKIILLIAHTSHFTSHNLLWPTPFHSLTLIILTLTLMLIITFTFSNYTHAYVWTTIAHYWNIFVTDISQPGHKIPLKFCCERKCRFLMHVVSHQWVWLFLFRQSSWCLIRDRFVTEFSNWFCHNLTANVESKLHTIWFRPFPRCQR